MAKDYYRILGISKNASVDEIKKAYRKLAQTYHPDKGGDPAKFKEINEAYQVLSDPQKRQQYDQFGQTFEQTQNQGGFSGFSGFRDFSSFSEAFGDAGDFEDIFSGIFGGGRSSTKSRRGQDIAVDVQITMPEAFSGVDREINIEKFITCKKCSGRGAEPGSRVNKCKTCGGSGQVQKGQRMGIFSFSSVVVCEDCLGRGEIPEKKCSNCNGHGRVKESVSMKIKIPAGISDGQTLSISGQGEAGPVGSASGNLYVNIHVQPHAKIKRSGSDLFQRQEISFASAVLGGKIEIEGIDGKMLLKIPAGIVSGTKLKVRGKGMPRLQGRGRGDMIVEVNIRTPKNPSGKLKKALKEIEDQL